MRNTTSLSLRQRAGPLLALAALLLAFAGLAGWYSRAIPLGEGPDEPGHAEYAFFVARTGRLPDQRSKDVPGEGHQPPLAYWLMQPAARAVPAGERRVVLANNPRWVWAGGDQAAAFAWRSDDTWPYRGDALAWHLLRLVSVLCGAATVGLTYAIGRRLGAGAGVALGAAALLAAWPQFIFHSALVSNDPLLWTLAAATAWLAIAPAPGRWWAATLGLAIGAALLVKQSALILLPLAGWAIWLRRRELERPGRAAAELAGTALLVAGWWYVRNLRLYGDLFGLASFKGEFASPTFSPFSLGDWREAGRLLGSSLVGRFGWMNVAAPRWAYWAAALIAGLSLVGWLRWRWAGRGNARPDRRILIVAALPLLALGWTFLFALITGQVGWQGRFVLPAAPVAALGLAFGLGRVLPRGTGIALAALIMGAISLSLPERAIRPAYPSLVVAAQPERPLLHRWAPDSGSYLELRGLDLPATARLGQPLRIGTLWHTVGPQDRDWTLFVHLAVPGERYEAFAADVQPQGGAWPATRWTEDDWWEDAATLAIPADLPPGAYDVRIGWFDERDGTRIGLRSLDGVLLGDYATVGRVVVGDR